MVKNLLYVYPLFFDAKYNSFFVNGQVFLPKLEKYILSFLSSF